MSSVGFFRPLPRHEPAFRLFCFPYAGGGAAVFRLWPRHLPDSVEVIAIHPPGRAHRLRELPLTRIEAMVDAALNDLIPWMDRPFALFGHSLGAIVASECALRLQIEGRAPKHLFVSARPPRRENDAQVHRLSDDEFIVAMNRRYQGIPDEILKHPDLLALLLPSLRADVEALETFHPDPGRPKISCPATVFGGALDRAVSRQDLEAWREEIAGPCRIRVFPGDHFYIEPQRPNLVGEIAETLRPLLKGPVEAKL